MSTDSLREELHRLFGHDDFRGGQREIVEAAVNGVDTLAVLPTGGGKSLTYQLPAMLVPGATLVLSPLIALMKDQAENLPPEVAARTTIINSSLDSGELQRRLSLVKAGRIKMVYAAPERLRQPTFLHALRHAEVSLIVVDEAHCISQWGHDFRPDYRAVGRAVESLNPRSVLAVTATATPDVADDIERQLGRPLQRIVRPTYRDNLYLSCLRVTGEDDKLWKTLEICQQAEGIGLVYAGSREKCEKLSRMLTRQGIEAGFYHAGLPPEERAAAQDRFMSGDVRVMAATVAFGMGVDKSDIRFLIHFHPSRTLENYYQEAGRAGRDGQPSQCILLHSSSDAASVSRHLREDTLTLGAIRNINNAIRDCLTGARIGRLTIDALVQVSGIEEGTVRATLPLLEEAGVIRRHGDMPRRLAVYPDFSMDLNEETPPEWETISSLLGRGGDFDPLLLAQEAGIAPADIEETMLRFQDAGLVTCRALGREMLVERLPAPADAKERMEATLAHRATGQKERSEAMLAYARDNKCRHAAIARYFGDRWPHKNCGMCDVCTGEPTATAKQASATRSTNGADAVPITDPAEAPLTALRLVADLSRGSYPFYLGKAGLMRALRGTPDAPIKPTRTPQYGKLVGYRKADVERLIEALVEQELLRRDDEDEYRRLYLTQTGMEAVQSGAADIEWRLPAASAGSSSRATQSARTNNAKETPPSADADPVLFTALKEWRIQTAFAENVPPYVIFADKTLIALAAVKPANEFDLLDISGIGPAKAAKYGEAVLEIVQRHNPESGF